MKYAHIKTKQINARELSAFFFTIITTTTKRNRRVPHFCSKLITTPPFGQYNSPPAFFLAQWEHNPQSRGTARIDDVHRHTFDFLLCVARVSPAVAAGGQSMGQGLLW